MNKQDEFWFWTMRAISEPSGTIDRYFYDKESNCLFGTRSEQGEMKPLFRNKHIKSDESTIQNLSGLIKKLSLNDEAVIELPRLDFEVKKKFLVDLAEGIHDSDIREKLINDANSFSHADEIKFKVDLKELSGDLYFKIDLEIGKFLAHAVKKMLLPLGVTENSKIVW